MSWIAKLTIQKH